jgi:hypothetical protein
VFVLWLTFGSSALATEPPVYRSYRFIQDVLITAERSTNEKQCRRFTDSPSVALLWGKEHQKEFDEAVTAINEALAPTRFSLRTMLPSSAEVQVKCFFAAGYPDYVHIRERYWLQTPTPHDWTWEMSWDESSRLTKGYVLINVAGCNKDVIRYRATRALLGAIGFNGWSSAEPDSIFSGQRRNITAIDRRLISFFYGHVPPDSGAAELRKAFDQFWSK